MRITIVGPGGLGTLLAVNLSRAKNDVWILDNDSKRAGRLTSEGITAEGPGGGHKARVNVTTDPKKIEKADAVFLCVKSFDMEGALKGIKGLLEEETYVVSLQDGLGNLQMACEYAEPARVVGGITSQSAELTRDGALRHTGKGHTVIGQANGRVMGGTREISSILNKAGFPTKITKDINSVIWSRLVISAGTNALSAVTRLKSGALVKSEYTREIMRRAVSEAAKVAKRKRIKLSYDDPIQKAEAVCKANPEEVSPMLRDVLSRRQTEIDFINGAIARQAKSLNIKTPTNEMLTELVKGIESNYASMAAE